VVILQNNLKRFTLTRVSGIKTSSSRQKCTGYMMNSSHVNQRLVEARLKCTKYTYASASRYQKLDYPRRFSGPCNGISDFLLKLGETRLEARKLDCFKCAPTAIFYFKNVFSIRFHLKTRVFLSRV
jgi:hypothetical protein